MICLKIQMYAKQNENTPENTTLASLRASFFLSNFVIFSLLRWQIWDG